MKSFLGVAVAAAVAAAVGAVVAGKHQNLQSR